MKISLRGGRIVGPIAQDANADVVLIDELMDLHVHGGQILSVGDPPDGFTPDQTVDVTGLFVAPGLVLKAGLAQACR